MKNLLLALMTVLAFVSVPAQSQSVASLSAKLTNAAGRPDADKARDMGRKPADVVTFLGIKPGMTVIDLYAAAGYYTEVLSHAVGSSGKVYMQNSPSALTGRRGPQTVEAIDARLANNRLSNVEKITVAPDSLGLAANSVDAAVIALEFHELYLSDNPNAVADFLAEIRRVLKPGGVLGIVEHSGSFSVDPGPLHRALESQVVADAQAAGFFVGKGSDVLRNINDDMFVMVFDPSIRGKTDRFVLKLVQKR
ncbi:MAG: class I SAM-dependent methyltransferase [Gammaproteobacteria bacterium]|nr:class I SAM-dependent methyltransferase [Gammaproteobacteria bacterium]